LNVFIEIVKIPMIVSFVSNFTKKHIWRSIH